MSIKRRYGRIATLLSVSSLIFGCGGESSSTSENGDASNVKLSMVAGDSVTVSVGDTLLPSSTSTEIEVVHDIEENKKTVTILSGKATLSKIVSD